MKHIKRLLTVLLMALMCTVLVFAVSAEDVTIIDSGFCGAEGDGKNLSWALNSEGTLMITGEGDMKGSLSYEYMPWYGNISNVETIVISDGVTSIGDCAFSGCSNLKNTVFPNSLLNIGSSAFEFCGSLKNVEIPSSVSSIGAMAFYGCFSLEQISVLPNNLFYSSDSTGCLFSKDKSELIQYPIGNGLVGFTIPYGVKIIKEYAFDRARIESVIIPQSVEIIEESAFSNCRSLNRITAKGAIQRIDRGAFFEAPFFDDESNWENGILYIGDNLFEAKESISGKYIIKSTTKSITGKGFSGCKDLTDIVLPSGLLYISDGTFSSCKSLNCIDLPSSVLSIGSDAFSSCDNLKRAYIPEKVQNLGDNPFSSCTHLEEIDVDDNNKYYCDVDGALYNKSKTKLISYPPAKLILVYEDGVTEVGAYALYGCRNLKTLWIPSSVERIGDHFAYNENLERIILPKTIRVSDYFALIPYILYLSCPVFYSGTEEEFKSIVCVHRDFPSLETTIGDYLEDIGYDLNSLNIQFNWNHEVNSSSIENMKEPSCMLTGSYDLVACCDSCHEVLFRDKVTIDALGHSYGEWHALSEPTCTEWGLSRRYCTRCTDFENGMISALGHDYSSTYTSPTCDEQGYNTYTCSRCQNSYKDNYVSALGHRYGNWYTSKEPTCMVNGTDRRDCVRCNAFETRTVKATGHIYNRSITSPTCTNQGYTTYTCVKGDNSYKSNYTNPLGHDYGEWFSTENPTCIEFGEEERDCSRCESFETRSIEPTGHEYNAVVTPPTCTKQGYTTYTCKRGDATYVSDSVPANGHTEVIDAAIVATCTETGLTEGKHCSVCSVVLVKQQIVPMHGHDFALHKINEPTCTEDGSRIYVCRYDASHKENEPIAKLGHTDADNDGICDRCKEQMPGGDHCKYCGKVHDGAFGWLISFFHSILAIFKR